MRKSEKTNSLEFGRDKVVKFLHDTMNETLNDGLPFDKDAQKVFSREEFNNFINDYRLYGNVFGAAFIAKILEKIDNMAIAKYREKEEN